MMLRMPTPQRTSLEAIVTTARDLLETEGPEGLTMQAVAGRVGVRAPSLYKHVRDRQQLLLLVAEATLGDLADRVNPAADAADLLTRFRAFGKERPVAFQLVMTPVPGRPTASDDVVRASSAAILRVAGDLVGQEQALEAARTLTAWATGFLLMEITGAFRLGGDLERAWEFGLARLVGATSPTTGSP
jgi:AcrR family transcriptional regulator